MQPPFAPRSLAPARPRQGLQEKLKFSDADTLDIVATMPSACEVCHGAGLGAPAFADLPVGWVAPAAWGLDGCPCRVDVGGHVCMKLGSCVQRGGSWEEIKATSRVISTTSIECDMLLPRWGDGGTEGCSAKALGTAVLSKDDGALAAFVASGCSDPAAGGSSLAAALAMSFIMAKPEATAECVLPTAFCEALCAAACHSAPVLESLTSALCAAATAADGPTLVALLAPLDGPLEIPTFEPLTIALALADAQALTDAIRGAGDRAVVYTECAVRALGIVLAACDPDRLGGSLSGPNTAAAFDATHLATVEDSLVAAIVRTVDNHPASAAAVQAHIGRSRKSFENECRQAPLQKEHDDPVRNLLANLHRAATLPKKISNYMEKNPKLFGGVR